MGTFETIYQDNYVKVFQFIYNITNDRYLAEDLTQETFIRAHKKISSFRHEARLSVWLNKIAYNIYIDFIRKKSTGELTMDEQYLVKKLIDMREDIASEIEQKIMSECVEQKLFRLPENYRALLFLDSHSFSNEEIANILNCTLANAKIRLHRARKKMKEILSSECSFYHDQRNVLC